METNSETRLEQLINELQREVRKRTLEEVVSELEDYYHPQMDQRDMHPADFITKRFNLDGHENLKYI